MNGYIFDFDGVVVDSMSMHLRAWELAHERVLGGPLLNPRRLTGMASTKIAAILTSAQGAREKADRLIAEKRNIMASISEDVPLLPGAHEVINSLHKKSIPVAICSNATGPFIRRVLDKHELNIDVIISIESTSTPKPHPAPYLLAKKEIGLEKAPHRTVVGFEDSKHGMRAANEAGLYCVGILSLSTADELIACGASLVFDNLEQASRHPEVFPK